MKWLPGLLAFGGVLFLARGTGRQGPPVDQDATPERTLVAKTALAEVGTQTGDKYWAEVGPGLVGTGAEWCGGFALWVLRQAGLTDLQWETGKGFCYRLPRTQEPKTGDIAYFDRNQHHAIVLRIENGALYTVDGNQAGESVQVRERPVSEADAFFSIEPLLATLTV